MSAPLFDPTQGVTVIEAPVNQVGCWAGASSVLYDEQSHCFYLTYRFREPRPKRGYIFHVARSQDGIKFENIWQFTKEEVDSDSMEKGCLVRISEDLWHLYISYVGKDNKWRIDVLQASKPDHFEIKDRVPVLSSENTNTEGVKDPVVLHVGNLYYMYYTYAHKVDGNITGMHDTGDIHNTGLSKASTGLATSTDGLHFSPVGCALTNNDVNSWDWYCTRITSVLVNMGGVNIAYYDGAKTVAENYEEKLGISVSLNLGKFQSLCTSPVITSPHASRSIRYLSVCRKDNELYYYYEYTTESGSHDLRLSKVTI